MAKAKTTTATGGNRIFTRPARIAAVIPYLWLVVFFLVPFGFVLKISLSQTAIAQPPYVPVIELAQGWTAAWDSVRQALGEFSHDNFRLLLSDDIYWRSYLRSLRVAAISTALLLAVGYPIAYGMARLPRRFQPLAMMLVIVPFWTSFLIRIYAWINILQRDGLLNDVLMRLRLIDQPLAWLATDQAMYIGIVYSYLPFMVLPLYAVLEKMDKSLLEAAADLGCSRLMAFWLVTVPMSLAGVGAGLLLCFIPIVGEFVIPDLLAGSDALMIGQTLWLEFFTNKDWPVASALAVVLLCVLLIPLIAYEKVQRRQLEKGQVMSGKLTRLSVFNIVSLTFGLAFLYLPIVILIVYSFNASRLVGVWGGWSLRWYVELFRDQAMIDAAWMSLRVALASASAATLLGTLAAVALSRGGRFKGRTAFSSMIYAPLVMPEVITGLSLLLLFVAANVPRGFWTVTAAHATLTMCFVMVVVHSRLNAVDRSLEEAAMDLGCSPLRAFLAVTLPLIGPAIAAGWMLAFALSLDDLVIASFTTGPGATTLPLRIYSEVRLGVKPEVNAVSTLIVAAVAVMIVVAGLMSRISAGRAGDAAPL